MASEQFASLINGKRIAASAALPNSPLAKQLEGIADGAYRVVELDNDTHEPAVEKPSHKLLYLTKDEDPSLLDAYTEWIYHENEWIVVGSTALNPENYKLKQDPVSESGTTLQTITAVEQNANGEIAVTYSDIQSATTAQPGVVQLAGSIGATVESENNKAASEKAVRDAINDLDVPAMFGSTSKTVTSISETDGKVLASYEEILAKNANIDNGAVTSEKIKEGEVKTINIADGAVTNDKLGANSVTTDKIADGTIQSGDIGAGQVTTTNIADSAVTTEKIGPDAVNGDKIADGAVDNEHIAAAAVHETQILDGSVTRDKIAHDAVNGDKIADDAIDNEHIADNAVRTEQIKDGSVTNSKITNGAVTYDKVTNTVGQPFPIDISGNAATATAVKEGGALDQRIGALETGKKDKQEAKADPLNSGNTENFQFISTITQDANGEITATKHTIPKSDSYTLDSSTTLATSKAVKSAIDSLNGTVQASSTNVSVSVTETAGKLTEITVTDTAATSDHVHGEINNDGTIGETTDLAVVTGESGAVTVADLSTAAPVATGTDTAFVTTVSQDSKGKITAAKANLPTASTSASGIVQLVDSYESNSTTMAPTANALKSAYEHSSQVIADLDYTNKLGNGQYITDLKQVNGLIDYGVANMATQPVQDDMKPITSGGVQNALLEEHDARVAFDAKIDSYLPDAVSSSNKLADKAYVDAIGTRLEARYLCYTPTSSEYGGLPFPTEVEFNGGQTTFYYLDEEVTPDNNDIAVVAADHNHQEEGREPPTTRYRYVAHKVQAVDEHGNPKYDEDNNPIWEWEGAWCFEYVINNSPLNSGQLAAVNSGITSELREKYDHHVNNEAPEDDGTGHIVYVHHSHMNPHGTTYTQTMQAEDGLDTTATELQSLHGLDTEHVGAAQFNALAGLNLENNQTIQNQLDVKADRVLPKYDTSGYSVAGKIIVGADTADQNGRYNIVDSGYGITQNYVPGDVSHVTTGSSITQAIQTLNATVSSATENKKVSVTVVEDDGKIKSVSVNDDNAASAAQGAKADTAIQNVIVRQATGEDQTLVKDANQAVTLDLSGYKPLQVAVSDPTASSDPTLEFISSITQDANGVISPVKNAVKVSSDYVVDGTDPVNGTAVTAALNTLDADVSSTKDVGVVSDNIALKVTEVNGKVTEVLVTKDNTVNAGDIATAIEELDYANPLQPGDYIKEISETDGKMSVVKDTMDTSPESESKKPITSGGVYSAIAALDATNQVSAGDYITAVNETDGKVSIVTDTMDTTPSADSQKPVTSSGVKTELDKKADKVANATANDIAMLDGDGNIADTGRFITNQYLDPDTTKTEEERRQVFMSNVPTGTAVKAIVDEAVSGIHSEIDELDATVSSADGTKPGKNVDVQVVEANGVITGVNIVRDDSINATDLSTAIDALDATVSSADTGNTSGQNVDVQVVETNGKITGVNIIRDDTVNAHDIEGAIADLNAKVDSTLKSGITKSNIGLKVTETAGEVTEVLITKDDTVNAQDVSSAITTALDALDLSEVGGSTNTYISAISETNGQVSATATQMNASIMDKSGTELNVAPTTGAVKDTIEALDYTDSAAQYNFVTAVSETDGKINVSKKTLKFEDVYVDPNNDNDLLPINKGGTGARTDGAARTALDVYSKGEVDSMVSGHGKFLGNLTATEINNLPSISNSDTVICVVAEVEPPSQPDNQVDRGDGTYITVRDGEQLIVSDKSGTPLWESVTGKFKLTQQAYSDARTSDDFSVIDGLTQNANGEVTTTRHSLSDASNIEGTATHGLMSATDKVKLDALPDRSDLDTSLAAKTDKVSNATAGNFAALDVNGNLTDSGHKHTDYKTVQTAVADPSAIGSTLVAIDTISQNANGEITVTKKNIQDGTTEQKGVVQLAGSIGATETENDKAATPKAVRDAIDALDVSNITGFGKGKTLATLTETNGKIAATFQDIDITSAHVTDKQTTTFDGTAETLTTGKAVKSALDTLVNGLDAEVTSTDGTNVQVKVTEENGKITAVNVTTDNTENKGNKVSSWSSTLTDGHYPSEKLVKTELDKKADKLTTATADNFVSFDVNGNLKDSGHKHSDYKTKQTAVDTATADTGSTLTFISSVTQDTNGVITPKTKTVTVDSTYSADGKNPVNGTAVAAAIGTLDSEKTGTGTNVTVKVKEVDGKIDSVTVTDTSASSTHVHGNITNDGKISLSGTAQTTKSVVTDENGKVTAFDLTTTSPDTDGTGTAFITSVSQGATGKISATKAALPTATVPSGSATTGTAGIVSLSNATNSNSQTVAATSKAVSDLATSVGNAKADKVSGTGMNGHLAGLDANGNLTDSGIAASNVKTKQSAKTDPTASGNALSFIDTITQNSNGEITATKKNVTVDDTYSADGTNPVNGKAVAHALGTLDATVTGMAANKTVATLTETDGKIAATFQDIHISMSQVDDFAHAHGNISYEGEIDSNAVTIGSGDSLVFTDSSNSNKVEKSSVTFDGSTTNQFLSKKGTWSDTVANATNATNDANGNDISRTYIKVAQKGVANGVATLDANGKIPTSQIPGSYDDVKEGYYYNGKFYSDSAHTTEIPAESDKVYVDMESNKTYRWSGTQYVVIGSDLALGETSSTAYRGDRGKTAYDHTLLTNNPHSVTAAQVGLGNVVNTNITVSATDGVTDNTNNVTYKYTHPTKTAVAASAKKVGYDNLGHVVLGDALTKSDVGLGNVDNTSDATKKTNFTGLIASGNTGFVTGGAAYTELNKKADKTATVSTVTYDTTDKKITKTINGTTTDVVTAAKLKEDMALDLVKNQAITVTSTSVSDGTNTFNKYTHPTYTAATAAAVKVGRDSTGHLVLGDALVKYDVGLGNVDNTSDDTKKTNFTGAVASGNTGFPTGGDVYTAIADNGKGVEIVEPYVTTFEEMSAIVDAGKIPLLYVDSQQLYYPLYSITGTGNNRVYYFAITHVGNINNPTSDILYDKYSCTKGTSGTSWAWLPNHTIENVTHKVSSWSSTTTDVHYPSEKLVKTALDGKASSTHTHGNITNAGALQTNDVPIDSGDKLVITDSSDSNKVARASAAFDGTTTTKALTQKGTFEDFAKQADIDEAIEEIPTISLVGDNHITVTSDDTTGTVTVATDIAAQTVYTAKGSATKVPQITTNSLGQVTGITEVEITGVTPAAHTHGSITNDGKIGSTANLAVVTGTSGAVTTADLTTAAPSASGTGTAFITSVSQDSNGKISASKANLPTASTSASGIVQLAGSIGTTVSSENNKAASEKAVRDAINALDVDSVGGAGKYISAISETNGKISATATTMDTTPTTDSTNAITSGAVKSALSGYKPVQTAKSSPTASGSTLAFIDTVSQDANGVITATKKNVTIDSTYSAAGTNPVTGTAVAEAIGTLDVSDITGFGQGKTLKTLTETDGKIAATFQDIKITKSQVSDFAHAHGNITNAGGITADAVTVASGDAIVVVDSSDTSKKVVKSSISFDGSTTTQALTKAGTWATFNNYSHPAGSAPSVTGFPAAGGTLSFGGTFDVNQVSTDSTSHVSSITKRTFTLPSLGTTETTAAKGNHTHTASIAADTGTSALVMTANTKYKLTAGGSTFIFTTPKDTTYTSKDAVSGGTDVSLVTTGEKWTWNRKQDALTEMTTAEVSALVAAFAS